MTYYICCKSNKYYFITILLTLIFWAFHFFFFAFLLLIPFIKKALGNSFVIQSFVLWVQIQSVYWMVIVKDVFV